MITDSCIHSHQLCSNSGESGAALYTPPSEAIMNISDSSFIGNQAMANDSAGTLERFVDTHHFTCIFSLLIAIDFRPNAGILTFSAPLTMEKNTPRGVVCEEENSVTCVLHPFDAPRPHLTYLPSQLSLSTRLRVQRERSFMQSMWIEHMPQCHINRLMHCCRTVVENRCGGHYTRIGH